MHRRITITVSEEVYAGLHSKIGKRNISRFMDQLARPHVVEQDIEAAYRQMAADRDREREALEWAESTTGDAIGNQPDASR
jgi:hypothetical protein